MRQHHVPELWFLLRRNFWPAVLCTAALLWPAMPDGALAADAKISPSQAQFGGQCTEALAQGRHVVTDCTSTWTDKDGKTYCFSSDDAKKSFLENSTENLQCARSFHGRQQRGIHRKGHAGFLRLRRRNPGQRIDRQQAQGESVEFSPSMIRSTASI